MVEKIHLSDRPIILALHMVQYFIRIKLKRIQSFVK